MGPSFGAAVPKAQGDALKGPELTLQPCAFCAAACPLPADPGPSPESCRIWGHLQAAAFLLLS